MSLHAVYIEHVIYYVIYLHILNANIHLLNLNYVTSFIIYCSFFTLVSYLLCLSEKKLFELMLFVDSNQHEIKVLVS